MIAAAWALAALAATAPPASPSPYHLHVISGKAPAIDITFVNATNERVDFVPNLTLDVFAAANPSNLVASYPLHQGSTPYHVIAAPKATVHLALGRSRDETLTDIPRLLAPGKYLVRVCEDMRSSPSGRVLTSSQPCSELEPMTLGT